MELVNTQQDGPFNRSMVAANGGNVGAIAIESQRAIAEVQGQIMVARACPRNINAAHAELMESCKMLAMANVAFYALPRGGKIISGPSIRLAEEIARVFGNFEYGHRELSRTNTVGGIIGKSEVEVYAWDKQTNNRCIRQITVMHSLDTKDGQRPFRDQKEIDDKIANIASKQMRSRILAMMPKWMVEAAIDECKLTLTGSNTEPLSVRVRKMTQAFAKFGVNAKHIETKLGHKLDDVVLDELVDLTAIFNALKDGEKPSDYFKSEEADEKEESPAKSAIAAAAAKGNEAVAAAKAAMSDKPATPAKAATKPKLEQMREKKSEPEAKAVEEALIDMAPGTDDGDAQGPEEDDVF